MNVKRWALCLLLLLCLTACGGTPEKEPEPDPVEAVSGMVYVPEFFPVDFEANYVHEACVSGGKVWLVGDAVQESEIEGPDGEMIPAPLSGTALFQGEPGGTAFRQVEGYRPFDFLNGADGYITAPRCWPGGEGSVWVWTSVSPWDGQPSSDYVQQFDAAGKELARLKLGALLWEEDPDWITDVLTDREDRLYVSTAQTVTAFDRDGRLLCGLDGEFGSPWNALVLLADGRAALRARGSVLGEPDVLRVIRPEAGDWGESYALPACYDKVYDGSGDWLFFCTSGDSLYGYNAGGERLERLLSWTGTNINCESVGGLAALADGRLFAVVAGEETVLLSPTDPASLPEMTVLTYATLSLSSETRSKIVEFNKGYPGCRIEVRDYSEYNTGTEPSAGQTRLQTEMLAGDIPDLLDTSNLPLRQYARRGWLEDLLPYVEGDPDLGREALMERVLDAALQDGKLYQAFSSFSILTAVGRTSMVGDRVSWTWADLREAMAKLPEGGTVFGESSREDLLELLLPMTAESLVDRQAGTVREEAVRSFLEFCGTAPLRTDAVEDIYTAALDGELLLLPAELTRLDSGAEIQMYTTAFGGACSYVGYPREDGGAGSCFRLWEGIAMTTACKEKEAAWAFLREAFLPKYPTGIYFGPAFPISRTDFDRMVEISTGPMLDETGQPMESEGMAWSFMPDSDLAIPIRPVTQEEYDHFMTLYNAVGHIYDPDDSLTAIIQEEANAYFSEDRSLEDTVRLIVNRAELYLKELQ